MKVLVLILILPILSFAGEPVATIGTNSIEADTFNLVYNETAQKHPISAASKEDFLRELIRLELGYLEAKRLHLDANPETSYQIKMLLSQELLQKELGERIKNIKLTEKEMKKYYQSNQQIRASHILLRVQSGAPADKEKQIKDKISEIYKESKSGKITFEDLAKKHSEDTSARRGGDLDFFTRDRMVKPFSDAAFSLKSIGDISAPVKTEFGWHVIQLTGKRSFKDADKNSLRQELLRAKRTAIIDGYFASLEKKYTVKTYPERLAPKTK